MRWSEVAPRAWRLGSVARGPLSADEEALRVALDALLENAVKYTEEHDTIELRAISDGMLVIEVVDGGCGIPPGGARPDLRPVRARRRRTRTRRRRRRARLAIVDAVAKAHGGTCTVESSDSGTVFALSLSAFRPAADLPTVPSAPVLAELPAVT